MKPEFSKPFDLAAAHSGAPFSGENGEAMRVLIWDRKHPTHPIIAIEERGEQEAVAFRIDGTNNVSESLGIVRKLVMLPLGLIEGKPVYYGDEFMHVDGEIVTALPMDMSSGFAGAKWPEPAKVYPVFHGDLDRLRNEYNKVLGEEMGRCLQRVADSVLRHAIDTGQVVVVDWDAPARAERDMSIAKAVLTASLTSVCSGYFLSTESPAYRFGQEIAAAIRSGVDLSAIIACIK